MIDKYQVKQFYTAPTAIRSLMRSGDDWVKKHRRASGALGTVWHCCAGVGLENWRCSPEGGRAANVWPLHAAALGAPAPSPAGPAPLPLTRPCPSALPRGCSRTSLRVLGSVGEPINPEAWKWYHEVGGPG